MFYFISDVRSCRGPLVPNKAYIRLKKMGMKSTATRWTLEVFVVIFCFLGKFWEEIQATNTPPFYFKFFSSHSGFNITIRPSRVFFAMTSGFRLMPHSTLLWADLSRNLSYSSIKHVLSHSFWDLSTSNHLLLVIQLSTFVFLFHPDGGCQDYVLFVTVNHTAIFSLTDSFRLFSRGGSILC